MKKLKPFYTLPELAEHLAAESGWVVAACSLSGTGDSPGTFSGPRWREDLAAVRMRSVTGPVVQVQTFNVVEGLKRQHEGDIVDVGVVGGFFL